MEKKNGNKQLHIGIIGGGPSGMMAALSAAGNGARVTLLEKNDRPGKKLLMTGNGKCNYSNMRMDASFFYAEKEFTETILDSFGRDDLKAFFEQEGMLTRERRGGLYPFSEQAATVLDTLRFAMERAGVRMITDATVTAIARQKDGKWIVKCGKEEYSFDRLILATGGKAVPKTGSSGDGYALAGSVGHSIVPVVPALTSLKCDGDFWKSISGVRFEGNALLFIDGAKSGEEIGELQFTDYGLSGIAIFQLSRMCAYACMQKKKVRVRLDFFPYIEQSEWQKIVEERLAMIERFENAEQLFGGLIHKKLVAMLMKKCGISIHNTCRELSDKDGIQKVRAVLNMMRSFEVTVIGTGSFEQAQVCAGGIPLKEVTTDLCSRKAEGLYITGELLDCDGKCGGYNLQWAFSTGYLAGKHAATFHKPKKIITLQD